MTPLPVLEIEILDNSLSLSFMPSEFFSEEYPDEAARFSFSFGFFLVVVLESWWSSRRGSETNREVFVVCSRSHRFRLTV